MPQTVVPTELIEASERMVALVQEAGQCVAPDKCAALVRRWIGRADVDPMSEDRATAMMADAALLSMDAALSLPSASGSTAFDRLAKNKDFAADAALLAALRAARFRLLRPQGDPEAEPVTMRDEIAGETVRVIGAELPPLPLNTALFGRLATIGGGFSCLPGAITPLNAAAVAACLLHPSARKSGASDNNRWADSVYSDVVRHGPIEVPGLNRPSRDSEFDDAAGDESTELLALMLGWVALANAPPDAELLRQTRARAADPAFLQALGITALARRDPDTLSHVPGFERMLRVQLETVQLRARAGSGSLSLETIERVVAEQEKSGALPPGALAVFTSIRRRLGSAAGAERADDAATTRLLQRIRALRERTVDRGCTEQEALAAAEKVAELLDRHGLSLGEIDFRGQACEGARVQTTRHRSAPIDSCVPTIAEFFDCRVWGEHQRGEPIGYVLFGLRADVAAAQYLYALVERAFETETATFRAGKLYADMAGNRRSASNSFQIGLAHCINEKLRAMRSAREANLHTTTGRDLVPAKAAIVDEELEKLGLSLRRRTISRGRNVLTEAFDAGATAAQDFSFGPGITVSR